MQTIFDVIVIGGGHAGIEASYIAAKMKAKVLLLTHNLDTIGQLSCNPSIGGIGKGQLVKEIDALGGIMGMAADFAAVHYRLLNQSKGMAVRSTRLQIDRVKYRQIIRQTLGELENLTIFEQSVEELIVEQGAVKGVVTNLAVNFFAPVVILTAGTFLNGKIHIGLVNFSAGRIGDPAAIKLANNLTTLGLPVGRLKTGTPPRLAKETIDFNTLTAQGSDSDFPHFSFWKEFEQPNPLLNCYITHTNEKTHEIIRNNLDRSPLFTGIIQGKGPRYCPSIEDKIHRFPDRVAHQIFLEPECYSAEEIYPNVIYTSFPIDVQFELVHSIAGLEHAKILRLGYAIEYDYFDPQALKRGLESRSLFNLFLAGQINGTTGYEEAAAQGILAGINAVLRLRGEEAWSPTRDEAYLGVMVDDLVKKGVTEPYRMFTSRAEYRLLLREDNAVYRLAERAYSLGCLTDQQYDFLQLKKARITQQRDLLQQIKIYPQDQMAQRFFKVVKQSLNTEVNALQLLKRSEINRYQLQEILGLPETIEEQLEIQEKYQGYIVRQQEEIDKQKKYMNVQIPENFNYRQIKGLSTEVLQKLEQYQPKTVAQAIQISGVTPAAISLLLIFLKK